MTFNKDLYDRDEYKHIHLKINRTTQKEIVEQIEKQSNKNNYIITLIKKDIEKQGTK